MNLRCEAGLRCYVWGASPSAFSRAWGRVSTPPGPPAPGYGDGGLSALAADTNTVLRCPPTKNSATRRWCSPPVRGPAVVGGCAPMASPSTRALKLSKRQAQASRPRQATPLTLLAPTSHTPISTLPRPTVAIGYNMPVPTRCSTAWGYTQPSCTRGAFIKTLAGILSSRGRLRHSLAALHGFCSTRPPVAATTRRPASLGWLSPSAGPTLGVPLRLARPHRLVRGRRSQRKLVRLATPQVCHQGGSPEPTQDEM